VLGPLALVVLGELARGEYGELLPAEFTTDEIAAREAFGIGLDDLADAPSSHHVAGREHRPIGDGLHPGAARGIEREKCGTDEHLASPGIGQGGLA
jgi:hypothetical protein